MVQEVPGAAESIAATIRAMCGSTDGQLFLVSSTIAILRL
jgi:hypothetical protein